MANIKISQLASAVAASDTQEFEVSSSGSSQKVTGAQIKTYVKSGLVAFDITDLTASSAELNVLDGITATTAELNILDGVTATTGELNFVDGVTSNIQTQLNAKASLDSPALTGTPTAPTATTGTNTTQLATTAFVNAEIANDVGVANSSLVRTAINASGSAPIYACRAWVNFNGTGVVAMRASGNVTSITDNATGNYTVNFTTAMSDTNYAVTGSCSVSETVTFNNLASVSTVSRAIGSVQIVCGVQSDTTNNGLLLDCVQVSVAIFR
jgi:hypothetical protein